MAFVRCPLLLCSQGLVLVYVGYAGKVLMSDQIASQGCFGLVSKHNRLQHNSLQAIAAFAIHIVLSRFLVLWTIQTTSVTARSHLALPLGPSIERTRLASPKSLHPRFPPERTARSLGRAARTSSEKLLARMSE